MFIVFSATTRDKKARVQVIFWGPLFQTFVLLKLHIASKAQLSGLTTL